MSLPANHVVRVKTLYRHALKNLQNWAVHRELFVERGFQLRAEFDANKGVTDPRLVQIMMGKAEKRLAEFTHPDPYTREQLARPPSVLDPLLLARPLRALRFALSSRAAVAPRPPLCAELHPLTLPPAAAVTLRRSAAHAGRLQVHAPPQ